MARLARAKRLPRSADGAAGDGSFDDTMDWPIGVNVNDAILVDGAVAGDGRVGLAGFVSSRWNESLIDIDCWMVLSDGTR